MSFTVACVLWEGHDPARRDNQRIYNAEWVRKMRDAVKRHNPGARFVCLSNVEVDAPRIALQHDWPSVWSKIEMFRPGLFKGDVLYLDLDTVIVGDLNRLRRRAFSMMRDPNRLDGCSAAMAWRGDALVSVYERFASDPARFMAEYPRRRCRDQAFIQDSYPATGRWLEVASYKADVLKRDEVPGWAAAVTFHGKPKPHEVEDPWVREAWA